MHLANHELNYALKLVLFWFLTKHFFIFYKLEIFWIPVILDLPIGFLMCFMFGPRTGPKSISVAGIKRVFAVLDFVCSYFHGFLGPQKYEPFSIAKIRTSRKNEQNENTVSRNFDPGARFSQNGSIFCLQLVQSFAWFNFSLGSYFRGFPKTQKLEPLTS